MNFVTSCELYRGSGRISRLDTTRRLGIRFSLGFRGLGAVLGTALVAVGDCDRVERSAAGVVAHAAQALASAAPGLGDRGLLTVVPGVRTVRCDPDAVAQPNARDLTSGGIRCLR